MATDQKRPAFKSHADEIAYLSALCECGHRRGDHMVNDGGCDVDGGCGCQSFTYSMDRNFEAEMAKGGTFADGRARND